MKELSKEELLAVIDTDIKAGEKIISSQKDIKVIKAVERRIQAYRQIRQLIESQPEVDEEFVERWRRKLQEIANSMISLEFDHIAELLQEAGVRIRSKNEK